MNETILFNKLISFVDNMLFFRQLDNREYQGHETGSASMLNDIVKHNHFDDFKKFLETGDIAKHPAANSGIYRFLRSKIHTLCRGFKIKKYREFH
ncbi:MAG: hypothetical protein LBQ14_06910 [Treponema sp.]|nr:hypothetical protein [Treponema sp.]